MSTPIVDTVSDITATDSSTSTTPAMDSTDIQSTSDVLDISLKAIDQAMKDIKLHISKVRTIKKEIISLGKSIKKLEAKKNRGRKTALDANGEKRRSRVYLP